MSFLDGKSSLPPSWSGDGTVEYPSPRSHSSAHEKSISDIARLKETLHRGGSNHSTELREFTAAIRQSGPEDGPNLAERARVDSSAYSSVTHDLPETTDAQVAAAGCDLRGDTSSIKSLNNIGQFIGKGSQKDVFLSSELEGRCVCLIRPDTVGYLSPLHVASKEIKDMKFLESERLPVVKSYGIVSYGDRYGVEREFIRRFIDSEDIILGKKELPKGREFNEKVRDSCSYIIQTLRNKGIAIDDLQFLIDENGRVLINDVRDASHGNPQRSINKTRDLRFFAICNLEDLDTEEDPE